MSVWLARWVVGALAVYFAIGVPFAVAFVARGAARVDPAAAGGTLGFRLVVLPGSAALWPLLLRRWVRGGAPPVQRDAHRDASRRSEVGP